MPTPYDLTNAVTFLAIKPAAVVAANYNGASFDLISYEGIIPIRADIGVVTTNGVGPTLDLSFKKSTDNGNWVAANINYTQATNNTTQTISIDPRALGDGYRYLRLDGFVGGTNTQSFPVSVTGVGRKQYTPG